MIERLGRRGRRSRRGLGVRRAARADPPARGCASRPTTARSPHEVGWIGSAVHLNKGCYRGQETVARVQNLGKPPRRLVLIHFDGSSDVLPAPGTPLEHQGRTVGFVGTAVQHFELGPIALAVIKRSLPTTPTCGWAISRCRSTPPVKTSTITLTPSWPTPNCPRSPADRPQPSRSSLRC